MDNIQNNIQVKDGLKKILIAVAVVEITYLLLVNAALSLQVTQTLVNQIKPGKFTIYWEQAWSWYPFRVHARGISANGQSRSQQWQVDATATSASIDILPLLWRTVKVSDVVAVDIEYFQRPRPRQDKDYAAISRYFPPIRDRAVETTVPVHPPKKSGNGWKMVVKDAQASGRHHVWIHQLQGSLSGTVQTDASFQSRGGPFSLDNGQVDILIDSLLINNDLALLRQGKLRGTVAITPFVPSENRGLKSLAYLQLDTDIGAQLKDLDFLSFYLNNLYGMNITGSGELSGHVRYAAGYLLSQTNLMIAAQELALNMQAYTVGGVGDVSIRVSDATPDTTDVAIRFAEMELLHEADTTPHFHGEGLELVTRGTSKLFPREGRKVGIDFAAVTVPGVEAPDLRIYQRYLPGRKGITINSGQGTFQGQAELTTASLRTTLQLRSEESDISLQDYRFSTNLELGFNIDIPSFTIGKANVAGTYVRLDGARLINRTRDESRPWTAALAIDEGSIDLLSADSPGSNTDSRRPSLIIKEAGFKAWLGQLDADFRVSGEISNLEWLNVLFVNPYDMVIEGSGDLAANLHIRDGRAARGSLLKVLGKTLNVNVLDYVVAGDGQIELNVQKGGEQPDLVLDIDVKDGLFRRQDENEAFVQDVVLKLRANVRNLVLDDETRKLDDLYLQIPTAKVTDMSIYNQYLPDKSPLHLLGGEADLTSYIHLQPDSAAGYVKLNTQGLRSRLNDQELSGELVADIKLSNGRPENLEFDISGSTFSLQDVKVTGAETNYEQEDWSARFDLDKGRTVWEKPVVIEAEAAVEIKDSRPFVALFSNEKGQRKWLEKMLTVENIQGRAEMTLENEQLVIPRAFVSSDKVDAGAKGVMAADRADGVFYARFRKLDAVMKIKNGKRNIDVMGAKKTFTEYDPLH
jgi:hypothetical protein